MHIWRLPLEARRELWNAVGYHPSAEQLAAHIDPHRLKQVAGGERAGKSYWTAHEIATWLILAGRNELIWVVGPDYELCRPEMNHLIEAYVGIGLIDESKIQTPAAGQWTLYSRRGAKIETKTSADIRKLAGVAPAGIAMTEAAQQDWEAFIRCRGRVAQKRGPLILSGTFETSRGWYPELFRAWQMPDNAEGGKSFSLPTWSNLALFPGGRNDPEIKALESSMPADLFMERYGAEPCPPSNLVLREFDPQVHVRECPFDKNMPVQVWVDPGYSGAYAVLAVQIHGKEVWIIDEVYKQGWVVHDVIDECGTRPWWENVSHGVIDIAGRQHHGMESQIEVWLHYGKKRLYSQQVPVLAGIERHRTFLRDPSSGQPLLFHDPRCVNTIKEYGLYVYPKSKEHSNVVEVPIDQFNHSIKAIAYGLCANFGMVERPPLGNVSISFRKG